ncbi:MAG: response regulator transcription factor [Chitinophagaceae bacterium]
MKILIIEDEPELLRSMVAYLKSENYQCETAEDFSAALEKIDSFNYDCIILDITLPRGSGLDILKFLKQDGKTEGIIIISAKNSMDDKVKGLNLGADDYLAKPFHLAELSARVAAIIRRKNFEGSTNIQLEELSINLQAKMVNFREKNVDLTKKEFELLLYLVSNKKRVVSKPAIAEHLSGDQSDLFDNFDFVYAHIKNLKRKLSEAGCPDYIQSIYGIGYKFEI